MALLNWAIHSFIPVISECSSSVSWTSAIGRCVDSVVKWMLKTRNVPDIIICIGSKWISNNMSRNRVHKFRSKVDAILIGSKTVMSDNPFLTARRNGKLFKKQPLRIVIDSQGQLSINYNIFNDHAKTLVITTKASSKKWRDQIEKAGHACMIIEENSKQVDLLKFAQAMSDLGIMHIYVEGGGKLIGALMNYQLIVKLYLFIAPKIIGNQKAINMIDGLNIQKVSKALKLINTSYEFIQQDILIAGEVEYK